MPARSRSSGTFISGTDGADALSGSGTAHSANRSGTIKATEIASGFNGPTFATSAPGDRGGLYVTEKGPGRITRIDLATGAKTIFLDIPDSDMRSDGEGGLLSVAFDPHYKSNGRFFVFVTGAGGDIEVRSYHRSAGDPSIASLDSKKVIIDIPHPGHVNHYGGQLAFGRDGYLYVSTGDGGGGFDPSNNAQDKSSLLGKILRLDVNRDGFPGNPNRNYAIPATNPFAGRAGADEIFALGLRNPYRMSFDSATGDLWIGDVGQGMREEIDLFAAGSGGGQNFGWRIVEGSVRWFPGSTANFTDPVYEYKHTGGNAVIGGYVYHGPSPGLDGDYIFADYVTGRVYVRSASSGRVVDVTQRIDSDTGPLQYITSFGTDAKGGLYAVTLDGSVHRLAPSRGAGDGPVTISGGGGDDRITGGAANDKLIGGAGHDKLFGGHGDDKLIGGLDKDLLFGGAGHDRFVFKSAAEAGNHGSSRDVIRDFHTGGGDDSDLIDVHLIDAIKSAHGNQGFTFIGDNAFTRTAGELHAREIDKPGSRHDITLVEGDINGDGRADFQIELTGLKLLTKDDFVL